MKDDNRFTMQFQLWKDFRFEAAHKLTMVPQGHPCRRIHGHSYRLRVHAGGFLDRRREWVVDYSEISKAALPIVEKLDHYNLNDILPYETTAENLAFWIGQRMAVHEWLTAIEVFETPTTSVFLKIR